jgi:hypothetical protein
MKAAALRSGKDILRGGCTWGRLAVVVVAVSTSEPISTHAAERFTLVELLIEFTLVAVDVFSATVLLMDV